LHALDAAVGPVRKIDNFDADIFGIHDELE
jgi:hypothetical protein